MWITIKEYAAKHGVSVSSVRYWGLSGAIPYIQRKIGMGKAKWLIDSNTPAPKSPGPGYTLAGERWDSPAKRAGFPPKPKSPVRDKRMIPAEAVKIILDTLRADNVPWGKIGRTMARTGFTRPVIVRLANLHGIKHV